MARTKRTIPKDRQSAINEWMLANWHESDARASSKKLGGWLVGYCKRSDKPGYYRAFYSSGNTREYSNIDGSFPSEDQAKRAAAEKLANLLGL